MIQLPDMMCGTLNCARNVAKVSPGEEVLILADTTTDPEIAEAYKIAYESEGAQVSILTVKASGAGASSEQITHNTLYGLFPPIAVEAAIPVTDCCLATFGISTKPACSAWQSPTRKRCAVIGPLTPTRC